MFTVLHLQPAFPKSGRSFNNSLRFAKNGLCLPMSNSIELEDVHRACQILLNILFEHNNNVKSNKIYRNKIIKRKKN